MKEYFLSLADKDTVLNSHHRQYLLFVAIGAVCFIVDISILTLLVELASVTVLIATAVSFVVATGINYFLNSRFVFLSGKHGKNKEVMIFFAVSLIALLVTMLLMSILVEMLHLWYVLSKLVTVLSVSVITFAARKLVVFKR